MVFLKIEGREDFYEIFDLEISHKEGELALATVVVAENCWHMCQGDVVRIMSDDDVLFCGKPLSFPKKIDDVFVQLRFVATCGDYEHLVDKFRKSDDCLPELSENCDVAKELTEIFPCRFCFDRSTSVVKIDNILPDKDCIEIDKNAYWERSLRIQNNREPISRINVSVDAQWIQECRGMTDLYPIIAQHFEKGFINSLNNLQRQWWRMSKSLPKSCYTVVHSHIQEYFPPYVPIRENFNVAGKDVYIKRFWFRGILDLRWHYRQKIREKINFSINGNCDGVEKNLHFHLGKLDIDQANSSYFGSDRGKKILANVAKRAINHMIASNRNIEVSLRGDFDKLSNITIGDSVKLEVKSGFIVGKVVKYRAKCTSDTRFVELKIASTSRTVELPDCQQYFEKNVPKCDDKPISVDDIVEKVVVNNPPELQIASARHVQNETIADLKRLIVSIPTSIRVKLKNLNVVKCLEKTINIEDDLCVNVL